jgi:hypothetical protein
MTELFKQDYKLFDKPETYYVFRDTVYPIEKHYIYGYAKDKKKWYIKVKISRRKLGSSRKRFAYRWIEVRPCDVDKNLWWVIQVAVNAKKREFDEEIDRFKKRLIEIPKDITDLEEQKEMTTANQFYFNKRKSYKQNTIDGVKALTINKVAKKLFEETEYLNF